MFTMRLLLRAMTCAGVLLPAIAAPAHSDDSINVLYAANDGVDSATCGTRSNPCRSINQTIAHADVGALIIVGPGHYGDLNRDGELTEEQPDPACRCVFDINKRVTVISREGAAQTILDMGTVQRDWNVRVAASGAIFGVELRGFAVISTLPANFASNRVGIRIEFSDRTLVAGNTVEMPGRANGIWIVDGTGHRIRGNISAHHDNGITVNTGGNRISGNSVYDNALRGIYIDGQDNRVEFNVSIGNGFGMRLAGPGHRVFRNTFAGNRLGGISIESPSLAGMTTNLLLTRNNFYGNGTVAESFGLNCGIVVQQPLPQPLDARNNYWGSAQGPGPDPADAVCNAGAPATVLVQPVAKKEIRIPMLW